MPKRKQTARKTVAAKKPKPAEKPQAVRRSARNKKKNDVTAENVTTHDVTAETVTTHDVTVENSTIPAKKVVTKRDFSHAEERNMVNLIDFFFSYCLSHALQKVI